MRFLAITLIVHAPDPVTGAQPSGPQQVIDKVHRYHQQLGHTVMHLHAEPGGLTWARHRASLELFQSDIAPALRRDIPDPPWPWAPAGHRQPAPAAAR